MKNKEEPKRYAGVFFGDMAGQLSSLLPIKHEFTFFFSSLKRKFWSLDDTKKNLPLTQMNSVT